MFCSVSFSRESKYWNKKRFVFLHLVSHLGVVQVEAGSWLGCGGVGVDSQHEGLFSGCNGGMISELMMRAKLYLLMRAAEVVCPSMPKIVPHM